MTTIRAIRLASLVTAINVLVASGFSIAGIAVLQFFVVHLLHRFIRITPQTKRE
jgi:hypothetical protein